MPSSNKKSSEYYRRESEKEWERVKSGYQQRQEQRQRGDAERMIESMMGGGGRMGDYSGGFSAENIPGVSMGHRGPEGTGLAGMSGAPQRQGRQNAEYYPLGMIPTASNMEHASQFGKKYSYSDTPDMADMVRAPWRPETWDPNSDYINQSGGANKQWGRMRGDMRGARGRQLIDRARGRL